MGRFLTGIFTALLTLAVLLGAALLLNRLEPETPVAEETFATEVQTEPETEPSAPLEDIAAEETLPLPYTSVPLYFQTDYPYIKYGNGTISTSGCSITSLAMVATYLTDHEYMPDELAYHFGSFGKNNIERLEHGNAQMQLPNVRTDNVQEVLQALREGKIAIAMMDGESCFTTSQHFIVLAGMTEDGKFLVNDPFGPNYRNAYLKNGFANGFEDYDLLRGFSGAWIYDKVAMPEEPFLFNAEKPEQEANRYLGYELEEDDIYTLACFAWAMAREEPYEVQQAVVEVVLNRVVAEGFPNTVHDVIYGSDLYSAVAAMKKVEEPEMNQYMAVTSAMYGPYVLPADVFYFSQWDTSGEVWGELGKYTFLHSK